MRYVVLDTDVATRSIKGRLPKALARKLAGSAWCVTFVTVGELWQWAEMRDWGERKRDSLNNWLDRVIILDGDDAVARSWGELCADAASRGERRAQRDSWVAACCLAHGLPLATTKLRDYIDFAEHGGLALITS